MHQQLNDFIDLIKSDKLIEQFPDHDIYLMGNFPYNETPDVDITIIGEVTPEIGKQVSDVRRKYKKLFPLPLDPVLSPNTNLFKHISRFNECTDDIYYFDEEITRYKLWPQKNNEYHGRKAIEINPKLHKVTQIFARKDIKYKERKWTYPILLSDLIKLKS